jgi:energy-converting hydrogenase B subunit D
MTVLLAIALTLVAVTAPVVVFTDDPLRQSMVLGVYGLFLTSAFFILQAPDVALSMLVVSSVLVPTLVLLALARIRRFSGEEDDDE